jgi:hypothetical protein
MWNIGRLLKRSVIKVPSKRERGMTGSESGSKIAGAEITPQAPGVAPTANVRITPEIPVIFADNIASHAWTPNLSKFYFVRIDSDPFATSPNTQNFVAQIVMPNDGFVRMVAFLEHRLKMMVDSQAVAQDAVDEARRFWVESQAKTE